MKALAASKYVVTLLLLTMAGASAHAAECDAVDLTGNYQTDPMQVDAGPHRAPIRHNTIKLTQNGCTLTINDPANRAQWTLDLSGKTETSVPQSILRANSVNPLTTEAFRSTRIRTKLVVTKDQWGTYPAVEVTIAQHIPKFAGSGGPNGAHAPNIFDVNVVFSGSIAINGDSSTNGTLDQVQYLSLVDSRLRLQSVNDLGFAGPIAKAFVTGANYILGSADSRFDRTFYFLNLQRVQ